jgi:hypothetical protein
LQTLYGSTDLAVIPFTSVVQYWLDYEMKNIGVIIKAELINDNNEFKSKIMDIRGQLVAYAPQIGNNDDKSWVLFAYSNEIINLH